MSSIKTRKGTWDVQVSLKKVSGSQGRVPMMRGVLPSIGTIKKGFLRQECLDQNTGLPVEGECLDADTFSTSEISSIEEVNPGPNGEKVFRVQTRGTFGAPSVYEMTLIRHRFLKGSI
jgi:hypothetical protein